MLTSRVAVTQIVETKPIKKPPLNLLFVSHLLFLFSRLLLKSYVNVSKGGRKEGGRKGRKGVKTEGEKEERRKEGREEGRKGVKTEG